ncbi:topoisomerase II-associated protein PAT1 [Coemansia spiralis]|nr:topoisomerase II-associated protein PAT1 [Coemansia spiralis]
MSGSFFGDGFSNDPIAREREAFRSSANNDLDARLESMALGDSEFSDRLDEDLDTFNDETFDADVNEIANKEFDFFQNTQNSQDRILTQFPQLQQQQREQPGIQNNLPQMLQKMGVSVQAAGIASANAVSAGSGSQANNNTEEPRKVMTLAELEAQIMQTRGATPAQAPSQPPPQAAMHTICKRIAAPEVIAQRREERLHKQAEMAKYNNMMSRHDKDYVVRIQVSQLLTDDPAADDFYYHMYQLSRGPILNPAEVQTSQQQQQQQQQQQLNNTATDAANASSVSDQINQTQNKNESIIGKIDNGQAPAANNAAKNEQTAEQQQQPQLHHQLGRPFRSNTQSSMARMQQQVQRIVNEARRRPKTAHVLPEGVLGKISVNSARNPKQVIQVQRSHAGSISQAAASDSKLQSPSPHDLGGIFSGLGDARNPAIERRKTLQSIESVYNSVLRLEQMIREQVRLPPNSDHPSVQNWISSYNELDASQPISNTYPHPLVRFLAFSKGKRIIPRLVHHLSIDQVLALTTTIIANFESLDVCRFGSFSYASGSSVGAQQREETDLFLHAVMPPTLAFLSETPLQIINGLFALFMERNNVPWVVRTRPALVFLTVLLGRSAALRQAGSHTFNNADKQDEYQAAELYNYLFNSLRGGLCSIFPPAPALSQMPNPLEDIHAWQFLATLAIGASVEQQHMLVAEVREKVLEKVQMAKSGHLPVEVAVALTANVNLFLNALGLDASQVAA